MNCYAVIDTNVLLSAPLSKKEDSATVKVLDAVFEGKIIPLYHQDILSEYDEVFRRKKFHLRENTVQIVLDAIRQYSIEVFPQPTGAVLIDMDDLIFYEVAMEKREDDAYLGTGNQKQPVWGFYCHPCGNGKDHGIVYVKNNLKKATKEGLVRREFFSPCLLQSGEIVVK